MFFFFCRLPKEPLPRGWLVGKVPPPPPPDICFFPQPHHSLRPRATWRRWNPERKVIEDSLAGEQFTPLPVMHFLPEEHHKKPEEWYAAPLYKTIERKGNISSLGQSTNFILAVELPSEHSTDYWVQKGAALVCALND